MIRNVSRNLHAICFALLACTAASSATADSLSGRAEAIFRSDLSNRDRNELNLFGGKSDRGYNTPIQFQGGLGYTDADTGDSLSYIGGVARVPKFNDTTILLNYSSDLRNDSDIQVKTALLGGVYVAGGINSTRASDQDTYFGNLSRDFELGEFGSTSMALTVRGGYVNFENRESGETGALLHSKSASAGVNWNEEELRAIIGGRKQDGLGGEVLYVDGKLADPGARAVLANFTLVSDHPFLSNPAREGRLLGRTGVSSANPILAGSGFLDPFGYNNFNRLQFIQDIGDGVDARVRHFRLPNGSELTFADALIFPGYFADIPKDDLFRRFFAGIAYDGSADLPMGHSKDSYGLEVGLKNLAVGPIYVNVSYRVTGLAQSDEEDVHDFLVYAAYNL